MNDLSTPFNQLTYQQKTDPFLYQQIPSRSRSHVSIAVSTKSSEEPSLEDTKKRLKQMEQVIPAYLPVNGVPPEAQALVKAYCQTIASRIRKRDSQGKLIPFFREYQLADLSTIVVTPVRTLKISPHTISVLPATPTISPRLVKRIEYGEYHWDEKEVEEYEDPTCLENDLLFDVDALKRYTMGTICKEMTVLGGYTLDSHIESMITARLVNTLWGMPTDRLIKYVMKRISAILDPKAKLLTRLIFGYSFKMQEYNRVCENLPRIEKLVLEARNLAPFIRLYLMNPRLDQVSVRHFQSKMPPSAIDSDSFFGIVRDTLVNEFGFTNGMWSWIARQNYRAVASTITYANSDISILRRWVEFSIRSEVVFPETVRKYLMKAARGWFDVLPARIAQSIYEGATLAKKQRRLKAFASDIGDVLDCLKGFIADDPIRVRSGTHPALPKNRVNSWHKLWNMQLKWHEFILKAKMEENELSWQSALHQFEFEGFSVIPLTNSTALYQEGCAQRHCVSSYTFRCVRGASRIFSIRKKVSIVATLEIAFDHHSTPYIAQCKGEMNKAVSSLILKVAQETCRRYSKAIESAEVMSKVSTKNYSWEAF